MIVIPAIDIKNGQCVRLSEGRFDNSEIYSDDPVKVAVKWEAQGAQYLHLVDLDGARDGQLINISTIQKVVKEVSIPIQVGGGIRTYQEVEMLVNFGVARIIIGTVLWNNKKLTERLFHEFPGKIIAGVDARDGYVAIDGWQSMTAVNAFDFAGKMEGLGAKRIIYTDIKRDGMMKGPNVNSIEKMLSHIKIPLIAAGGVTTLDDIRKLKRLEDLGLEAVIIGKALYKKTVLLENAISLLIDEI